MQKSLFNFFAKTPKNNSNDSQQSSANDQIASHRISLTPRRRNDNNDSMKQSPLHASKPIKKEDDDDDDTPRSKGKRRRLTIVSSDEDEDENERDLVCASPISQNSSFSKPFDNISLLKRKFASNLSNTSSHRTSFLDNSPANRTDDDLDVSTSNLNASINDRSISDSFAIDDGDDEEEGAWLHLTLPFLQPEKIKDISGRRPSHPEYDGRTLFVPEDFLKKQSPGMRQWWILKSTHFDTILFFKVGKFYELYHQDAVTGVEELRLSFMKGGFAHSGFPETAFQKMADRLLHRGYKVARVEQTETADTMVKRTTGRPGNEKVVRREICQVITPGTWFASLRSGITNEAQGDSNNDANNSIQMSDDHISAASSTLATEVQADLSFNRYLLAVLIGSGGGGESAGKKIQFGIGLLKAATGEIQIGQFEDDIHCSRLCTVIAHYPPAQILFERGNLNTQVRQILKSRLPDIPFEGLAPGRQFLIARDTISALETASYFSLTNNDKAVDTSDSLNSSIRNNKHGAMEDFKSSCPPDLLRMLDPTDFLGRTCLPQYELAIRCLGALVFYLKYCLTDTEILSLGQIREYQPLDVISENNKSLSQPFYERQVNMILDSVTLENLEILSSESNGSMEGTLIERLDSCCTPFGRRLMRSWLVNPPCHPSTIVRRQDAIDELMQLAPQLHRLREGLRRLPDLERLLTKVHIMGWNATKEDHPDSRAVLFEEGVYSKKKIIDFLVTLNGFKAAKRMLWEFSQNEITSEYLRTLTNLQSNGGSYPDYEEKLKVFDDAFNHEKARREGIIHVEPGFDLEFDTACNRLKEVEQLMNDYLDDQSEVIGCKLSYSGTGKNRFQIEVPDSHARRVPSFWEATSQKKGAKRYRNDTIIKMFAKLVIAEDIKEVSMQGIMRRIFASFSRSYADWQAAIRCLGELDCLMSLANYSATAAAVTCRPEFYSFDGEIITKPFLDIVDGLHPCLLKSFSGNDITPNDLQMGAIPDQKESTLTGFKPGITSLLITGPNMGGKSTIMRQAALLVILAHLGCHVPASRCRLTPVDRIFTRIGASDRLISGQSTFYVELAETAVILRHASPHSLVLIDELGRGTSTRDGSSLAGAVLRRLSRPPSNPLVLFSTHYHQLADSLQNPVTLAEGRCLDVGHMDCLVGGDGGKKDAEKITFLYRLIPGACPKSYGFNVAHLAHIPEELINKGVAMAKEFEKATMVFSCLRDILSGHVTRSEAQSWKSRMEGLAKENIYKNSPE